MSASTFDLVLREARTTDAEGFGREGIDLFLGCSTGGGGGGGIGGGGGGADKFGCELNDGSMGGGGGN